MKKFRSIFSDDMCVGENASQSASVRVVRCGAAKWLLSKPCEAGLMGRRIARERTQFSATEGNGVSPDLKQALRVTLQKQGNYDMMIINWRKYGIYSRSGPCPADRSADDTNMEKQREITDRT